MGEEGFRGYFEALQKKSPPLCARRHILGGFCDLLR